MGGWGRAQLAPRFQFTGGEPKRFDPSHPTRHNRLFEAKRKY